MTDFEVTVTIKVPVSDGSGVVLPDEAAVEEYVRAFLDDEYWHRYADGGTVVVRRVKESRHVCSPWCVT